MRYGHSIFIFLIASLTLSAQADVTTYTLDPTHTQVTFGWDHFGFSSPNATFKSLQGSVKADDKTPENSSVEVAIQVDSLDTGVALLDEHLLTDADNYFKVKDFPTITFKSKRIENIDKDAQTFDLIGTITINGIAKDVTLNTTLNKIGEHPMWDGAAAIGLNATTTLKRSDFGMGMYAPAVSDQLKVNITAEGIEAAAYEKAMASQS